jgi:Ca2+:H+ antiporter
MAVFAQVLAEEARLSGRRNSVDVQSMTGDVELAEDDDEELPTPRTPRGLWRLAAKAALAQRDRPTNHSRIVWGGFPFDLQEARLRRQERQGSLHFEASLSPLLSSHSSGRHHGAFETAKRDALSIMDMIRSSKLNLLLLAVPIGISGGILGWPPLVVFGANFSALLPLALILGELTEDLIHRFGDTIGGLLNATFGNVVEMILGLAALGHGLLDVVAASLVGSILSNLLLVLGCCFFFGGTKYKTQYFNNTGNKAATSLLFLACISIVSPTAARHVYGASVITDTTLQVLSRTISVLLVSMYLCYLYFQLKTHTESFSSDDNNHDDAEGREVSRNADRRNSSLGGVRSLADQPLLGEDYEGELDVEPVLSLAGALGGLTAVTLAVAACSEYLTGSIEAVTESTSINKSFLGIILLPIAGNAAEHFTAVFLAVRNKMDAAISIAVGSSIQIAVFVLPVTVLVGWAIGQPFTLNFDPFAVIVMTLSVILAYFVMADGRSNWFFGLQLLLTYAFVSSVFFLAKEG